MQHPARQYTVPQLVAQLYVAVEAGHVRVKENGFGLKLYTYTEKCVFERAWTPITEMARGLIVADDDTVMATPFPKFYNYGERDTPTPDLSFEAYEKLDGSLIIAFWDDEWRTATKGSFFSTQAEWAYSWLRDRDASHLVRGHTYLFEYIGRENRIVIDYPESGLIVLGAYDEEGYEYDNTKLAKIAASLGTRVAYRHNYPSLAAMVETAATLPHTSEGFVVRFANGYRLKIKGDAYCRIHRLVSRVTPLAIWDMLRNGDDMVWMRRELPEEFQRDFDAIHHALMEARAKIVVEASDYHVISKERTDKELGLHFKHHPFEHAPLVWHFRKDGDVNGPGARSYIWKCIRPTRNVLPRYTPSSAVNRFEQEE